MRFAEQKFIELSITFLLTIMSNDKFSYRKKQALEDLAVKPVTQFPVEISNEDAFATFKNVRHVTIKKVLIDFHRVI